jgi:hypothetical protein
VAGLLLALLPFDVIPLPLTPQICASAPSRHGGRVLLPSRREKKSRIKAFDNEPVILERKVKHRAEWLAIRGR